MSYPPKDRSAVLVVQRTVARAWAQSFGQYLTIVAVIGTGWLMDSSAMQWTGFALLAMVLVAIASQGFRRAVTPQEAADTLRRDYGVVAGQQKTRAGRE